MILYLISDEVFFWDETTQDKFVIDKEKNEIR